MRLISIMLMLFEVVFTLVVYRAHIALMFKTVDDGVLSK